MRDLAGQTEWTGDWSEKSDKWNAELKEILHFDRVFNGTGCFYIAFDDYISYYNSTCICKAHLY